MTGKVKTLIVLAPGTNCDAETEFAFQQAGAATFPVHIGELIRGEERLSDYQIMVIPGGFTYGDDVSAGKVLANELRLKLGGAIKEFVRRGGLVLGICNGFQVLVKAGILPDLSRGEPGLTLSVNDSGRFECRWVYLKVNRKSPCVFTAGVGRLYLPVAHGEGKVIAAPRVLSDLSESQRIVLRYADEDGNTAAGYPYNPNGSVANIAGICDASGRIFALMPHPERHIQGTQHPRWTGEGAKESGDGLQIFINAVEWARRI